VIYRLQIDLDKQDCFLPDGSINRARVAELARHFATAFEAGFDTERHGRQAPDGVSWSVTEEK